ncbi:MAG: hypothetical protein QNL53_06530 [Microbacteriaceae bacterium]
MELVLVITAAGILGLAMRYIVPGRTWHGLAVMPSAGVIIGSLVWVICLWAGFDRSSPWPWVISLGLSVIGCVVIGLRLPQNRKEADTELWAKLTTVS